MMGKQRAAQQTEPNPRIVGINAKFRFGQ